MDNNLPTILLVEDQGFSITLFKGAFPEYTIFTAASGAECLETYGREKPDITFLDIGLPDISGLEILKTLIREYREPYVIMLSSMNNDQYVRKSLELGARGFLAKPYNKDFIQHYIHEFGAR
jgi:two-component system chemotaxis response regulator CheY